MLMSVMTIMEGVNTSVTILKAAITVPVMKDTYFKTILSIVLVCLIVTGPAKTGHICT